MAIRIHARDEEQALLHAFVTDEWETAPSTLILHGPPDSGKTLALRTRLETIQVRHSWINCDECVSYKVLWKKIIQSIQLGSGHVSKKELKYDALATSSFQAFLKQLSLFMDSTDYNDLHYLVLDRADQILEESEDIYRNFIKIHEVTKIKSIGVIFVVNSIPRTMTTNSFPRVFFPAYSTDDLILILSDTPMAKLPVEVDQRINAEFWAQYVKFIVEAYSGYTNNLSVLKNIVLRLWPKFVEPIESGEVKPHDFFSLSRRHLKLIGSEWAISSILHETESQETLSSNLPTFCKYLIVASYLASFNDAKHDWSLFSKLKDYHRRRTQKRPFKIEKVNSRLLEAKSFELERMFAILHAIASLDMKLTTDIDFMTQVANLASMKLLLKSHNVDYISSKTKWKINCPFEFVKELADDLGFPMENYLVE